MIIKKKILIFMENIQKKKFRRIDLFDLTSFFAWTFLKFLACCVICLPTCSIRKISSLGGAPMEKNPIKAKLIWRFYPIPWASSLGDERWCWNSSCPTKYQWFWVWLFTSLKELLHWLFLVSNLTKSPQSTSLKEMFKLFANNIFLYAH